MPRPEFEPSHPLSLRDTLPLLSRARAAVRKRLPWPTGTWGQGEMILRNGAAQLLARRDDAGLHLLLTAQGLEATLIHGRCTLRDSPTAGPLGPGGERGQPQLVVQCDPQVHGWLLAQAAVLATGDLSERDRAVRFATQTPNTSAGKPPQPRLRWIYSGAPHQAYLAVEVASRRHGLRWSILFQKGRIIGLIAQSGGINVSVGLRDDGWAWRVDRGPIVSLKVRAGSATKASQLGLPTLSAKITGDGLEAAAGRLTQRLASQGGIALGTMQVVVGWREGKLAPQAVRAPVWGVHATQSPAVGPVRAAAVGRFEALPAALRRAKLADGTYVLQVGDRAVGGRAFHGGADEKSAAIWVR